MMTHEELINSVTYWSTEMKLDFFRVVDKFLKKNNIDKDDAAKYFDIPKNTMKKILNGDFPGNFDIISKIYIKMGRKPKIITDDIEKVKTQHLNKSKVFENEFCQTVFLQDNNKKIRKALIDIGYNYTGSREKGCNGCIYTLFRRNRYGSIKPYFGFCRYGEFHKCPESPGSERNRIDCGRNKDLFLAIAALKTAKTENNINQWFADNNNNCVRYYNKPECTDWTGWHKMSLDEIIKHFACMEPAFIQFDDKSLIKDTINILENFGYKKGKNWKEEESSCDKILITEDNFYIIYHEKRFLKPEFDSNILLKPIDCKNNYQCFLGIAALKNDTDKYQFFKFDNVWKNDYFTFPKGTWFICNKDNLSFKYNNIFIEVPAHKAMVSEIVSHFMNRED